MFVGDMVRSWSAVSFAFGDCSPELIQLERSVQGFIRLSRIQWWVAIFLGLEALGLKIFEELVRIFLIRIYGADHITIVSPLVVKGSIKSRKSHAFLVDRISCRPSHS